MGLLGRIIFKKSLAKKTLDGEVLPLVPVEDVKPEIRINLLMCRSVEARLVNGYIKGKVA